MTRKEREEAERNRHEYLLQEIRLTGEYIKDEVTGKFEKRVNSLEHWRTKVNTIVITMGSLVGWEKMKRFF